MPRLKPANSGSASVFVGLYLCVLIARVPELVPGLAQFHIIPILCVLTGLAVFSQRLRLKENSFIESSVGKLSVTFFVLALLSVPLSIAMSASLDLLESVLIVFLTLLLIAKSVESIKDVSVLFRFLGVSAAILTLSLLLTYKGGRAHTTDSYDPNDIGYVLVTLLPIVLALRSLARGLPALLWLALALGMLVSIGLTGSRGAFVAVACLCVGLFFYPMGLTKGQFVKKSTFSSTVLRMSALIGVAALLFQVLPSENSDRFVKIFSSQDDYNMSVSDQNSRRLIWYRDIQATISRPIGYGVGSAPTNHGKFLTAHNSLVQVLVELGVGGLVVLVGVFYSALSGLKVAAKRFQAVRDAPVIGALYVRAMRFSLLANFVAGFFLSQGYSAVLWCLIGLSISIIRISVRINEESL